MKWLTYGAIAVLYFAVRGTAVNVLTLIKPADEHWKTSAHAAAYGTAFIVAFLVFRYALKKEILQELRS